MADPLALPTARQHAPRLSYLDDPRVFFAAERTLLAWQRTSMALIGLGLVIERFGAPTRADGNALPDRAALASALLFLIAGTGAAMISLWQYRRLLCALSEPEVPPGYMTWPGTAISILLASAALAAACWMIASA